jgi:hypothetical protein
MARRGVREDAGKAWDAVKRLAGGTTDAANTLGGKPPQRDGGKIIGTADGRYRQSMTTQEWQAARQVAAKRRRKGGMQRKTGRVL